MKTLTPTQYQSLPVNEQSNWKPVMQYSFKELELPIWHDCEIDGYDPIIPTGTITQIIYIPITQTLKEVAYDFCQKYKDIGYAASQTIFIAGHSQGKKDHNKEVIDIVEAEIAKLPTNKMSQHAISIDPKTTLTELLTKLKEIK